ncbi:MAG: hypothetical protein QX190_12545 [Methylococcales bacterium]
MNVHLKPISFRKYSLILLYSLLIMALIAWGMEFYFERLYGDLTRIGHFSERGFGWQSEQPAVLPEYFKDYPMAEADILVIGDSFSVSRVWQSKLIANGLKVGTMTWQELKTDEALRTDLGVALRAAGFKGRYVIIESIERLFQGRMKALSNVREPIVKHDLVVNSAFPMYPLVKRERVSFDKLNGADWGVKAVYNSIKLSLKLPEKYLKSGAVQAINFDGCAFFSHRLCNYAIFVLGDFEKETFNSIDNVLTVNKNLQASGFQPIWLIVPDKATIYLGYGEHNKYPYQNIWQNFAQHPELIGPDLGAVFTEKSRTIKDFYMPNDTHLSTNGFLYLGEFVTQGMRNLQANQPAPFSH